MIAKLIVFSAVFGAAFAGIVGAGAGGGGAAVLSVGAVPAGAGVGPSDDVPAPRSVTYNVPATSQVSYAGAGTHKSVETYSAPSIEKTTTITRTITAPINAPAERHVAYSAPSAPILRAAPVAFAAPAGFASPLSYGGFGGGLGGIGLATTYSAPSLGYSLGGGPAVAYAAAPAVAYAAAPSYQYAAAPLAVAAPVSTSYGAPAVSTSYGAPAPAAQPASGGYS